MTNEEITKETSSTEEKKEIEEKSVEGESVDEKETLKDEIAESYLLSLDAKKEGVVGMAAGLGIAANPLHTLAKNYLLDKSQLFDPKKKKIFAKIKDLLLKKMKSENLAIPNDVSELFNVAYDKVALDKMKELLLQHKDNKQKLEEIRQQIEEGKDPFLDTETIAPVQQNKSKQEENNKIIESKEKNNDYLKQKIESELQNYAFSPLTATMIIDSATKHNVPVEYIMAIMRNDSHYGTKGIGAKTHNPGNVGNTDDGSTKDRATREKGVDAVAENLARRIKEYQKIYGNTTPSIEELANNQGPDKKGFLSNQGNYKEYNLERLGAYMTNKRGGHNVQKISNELAQNFSQQEEKLVA